jgi:hypothetical protein
MPAFSFKKQFVAPIQAGTKKHTIRGERTDGRVPAKVGDNLSLFCGMRTKGCFRILPGTVLCSRVESIEIDAKTSRMVTVDGVPLDYSEREALAVADGFRNWDEMLSFWEGRLPFKGFIIHWR